VPEVRGFIKSSSVLSGRIRTVPWANVIRGESVRTNRTEGTLEITRMKRDKINFFIALNLTCIIHAEDKRQK